MDRSDLFGIRQEEEGGVWIPERESEMILSPCGDGCSPPVGIEEKMGKLRF